jgi:hypothetical protein
MRITFIGHASIFIEAGDVTLLTDPWWAGPCFGAQWWIYPGPYLDVLAGRQPQYIYLSHGHNDHLHPGTLAKFSRNTKILVAKSLDLAPSLREMGFTVLEVQEHEPIQIGPGVEVAIRPTIGGDTFLVVSDGKEVCVNLNDALHATPTAVQDGFIAWIKQKFPVVDYVFCGYGTASHFPNCYRIPGKDYARTAARRQHHFNSMWARIIQELNPHFAFPFAADVVLLEKELFWANEPVHNAERPMHLLHKGSVPSRTTPIDIAPGFTIENSHVTKANLRTPVSSEALAKECEAQIERANYYGEVQAKEVQDILPLLQHNLSICDDYLRTFPGSYNWLLRLRNSERAICVSKAGKKISVSTVSGEARNPKEYDLIFTTRLSYLKRSLDSKYGNEIMFVGSGCLFEFPDAEIVSRDIHVEVRHIVQQHEACPPPRYGSSSPFVFHSKQLVKRILGMRKVDLYDLENWTTFEERKP